MEAPSTPELGGGTPKRRPRNAKPILEPEDIEAAIEECNANDDAAPIKPQEVATPSFRTIDDEEYTAPEPANPWKRPAKYIQHVEKPLAALEKSVEYDLDSDDESFRLALNTKMKNKSVLNENTLEKLIDTFEKEYFRQVKAKGILATVWDSEEDFRCNVCNSAATEPKNPIIYCDTCDMTTHVECYGLHNTPRGSWFCTKCKSKEQLEVSCILCTERNGAFKRTKDGEWVHLACAMWLSEKENVLVPTNLKSTFVVDTSGVAREKRDLLCCICGRSHGGCVTCSHSGCQSTYHITCAMRMGLFAEIKKSKTTTFKSFCKKHSTLYCEKKKESQKTKRRKEEEKILGEEYTQLIPVTMLTVRNLGRLNKEVVQDTYDYWKKKRLAAGRPLIGRLQIEEEEIRHSSSYKQEREYTEMRKIRQGMEIARLLLDLVGKRERLKQRQLATMQELFEQELLLGEPFELPKTKAKGEKEKKTTQPAKKETSVTHRRKSSGGAVKATVQQEIDDAVKKSATTSRRKSSTALPDDARKKAAAKKKEEEEEEVADAGAKRKRSEVEGGNKRPRATKTRRRSNSLESGAEHEETEGAKTPAKKTTPATKKPEARNLSANKVVGGDQPKPRAVYKRKSEQTGEDEVEEDKVDAANEKGKTTTRRQDEEQGKKKTATTAEVSPVKRVAKRRRLSASPTKAEPMEEEKVVNIVDSDEDVPAAKASTKGKNVSTRKAAPKDEEEEPEEEGERDDHDDDESNEGEQDGDDQDYMKGKRKRKRRSLNEVTAQRVTRAQAKWSSPHDEEPEEAAPLPVVSKKAAPSGAHRPSSAAANKKPQPPKPSKLPSAGSATSKAAPAVKVDVVDDDDDEEDDDNGSSEEESYSPTTSPESSPLRRGKDTDGPIVAKKKRQTKINGFFAVVKKAEKTSAMAKRRRRSGEKARLAGSNKDKDVDEEDDDERSVNERMVEKNREEEVDDDMDDDDNDHEEEKGRGKKKVKAKRTSGGGRRSLAQQKATAAAAAAAAAKRPLQAKKSR